ncbi:BadF/BadG/BcrA/BcrD ATPase family protein [Streptomyces sp. NPDC049585]|uniref:BadF/BadG/BcrA/BcrD ATPase family protein n=1 Tax=Streptomyces sp. NPDC049585 TaxID=3155154 RepID=UPI003423D2B8
MSLPAGPVLGVDSGGSGLRIALTDPRTAGPPLTWSSPVPVGVGPRGIDAPGLLEGVLPAARDLLAAAGAAHCAAVCVGAAGMATLGDDLHAVLPGVLRAELGARRLALAADAVTAYAGALGQRPGVVVAAGTGLIALGTDLRPGAGWRRADGWGHLLGDCGSGAWIGRAGLEAAMRALDGRDGGSAALLQRAEALFGPVCGLPALLYPRQDRPAVLASFAPEVARCAGTDAIAAGILRAAAGHIAVAAAAACPPPDGPPAREVALTGGLLHLGEPLLGPVHEELRARLPHARPVAAQGDPLQGALRVATALAADDLMLPADGALLRVVR